MMKISTDKALLAMLCASILLFSGAIVFASGIDLGKDKQTYANGETAIFTSSVTIDDDSFPVNSVTFNVTGANGTVTSCAIPYDTSGYSLQDVSCGDEILVVNLSQSAGSGWLITGYFTPFESEYSGSAETVTIFDGSNRTFKADFIDAVENEGWGKTESGDYLGFSEGVYNISDKPRDFRGNELVKFVSAGVDPREIPIDTSVTVPLLPDPWNNEYLATDIGPSVVGKIVNIYLGEGKDAAAEISKINGTNAAFGDGIDSGDIKFDYIIRWTVPDNSLSLQSASHTFPNSILVRRLLVRY